MSTDLSTLTVALAERVKAQRTRTNLTQRELAEALGVSERTVQNWEAAMSFPRPSQRRLLEAWFTMDAA